MKKVKVPYIIHGFALLHVLVTVFCAFAGLPDSLLLTVLTMTMTVLICLKWRLNPEFTAINVILVNIFGFILGHLGAHVIGLMLPEKEILDHALSTFVTTEILGWSLELVARKMRPERATAQVPPHFWKEHAGWLIFAVAMVFALRVFLDYIFARGIFQGIDALALFRSFLSNSLALIVMIVGTAFLVRAGRHHQYSLDAATLGTTITISVLTLLGALIQTLGLPFRWIVPLSRTDLALNTVIALIVELTLFTVTYMISYALSMRDEMIRQRQQRHRAEFRYMTLKHQVNPHFLFNSLNILDSIVQDGSREEASEYIHRLSGIYRYLLQHGDDDLIRVGDEVDFFQKYWELLHIRFPEGLEVDNGIRDDDRVRMIVPCTLQLLLENVTKHNAISPDSPVHVRVHSDGSVLEMENNLLPKASASTSTGLGLQYIRQQYLDLSGQDISAGADGQSFRVRIPLL